MFFSSVKGKNRLISKGMSNIYFKVTIEEKLTFSKLGISKFKKFISESVFGELQLTQISLNFKTPYCNLKIRGMGAKPCAAFVFLKILFWEYSFIANKQNKPTDMFNKQDVAVYSTWIKILKD